MYKLLLFLILIPTVAFAAPQDAELFTHIAGINLADLPELKEIQNKFGESPITETGDAGEYNARICYRTNDRKAVVEFFHGEVNWGFLIRTPQPKDSTCPISKELVQKKLSIAEIKLGMNKAKYIQIMGKPSRKESNGLVHYFEYVHTLTDAEFEQLIDRNSKSGFPTGNPADYRRWDVGILIRAVFTRGQLSSFSVNRVETN